MQVDLWLSIIEFDQATEQDALNGLITTTFSDSNEDTDTVEEESEDGDQTTATAGETTDNAPGVSRHA